MDVVLQGLGLRGRLSSTAGSVTGVGRGGTSDIPPAGCLLSARSESSSALGGVSFLSFSRSAGRDMVSPCGVHLRFSDQGSCRLIMSPSAVWAIRRAFQKESCRAFARLPLSLFLSESYKGSACVLDANPLSDARITSVFSHSLGLAVSFS